jgi:hypothetical protein
MLYNDYVLIEAVKNVHGFTIRALGFRLLISRSDWTESDRPPAAYWQVTRRDKSPGDQET